MRKYNPYQISGEDVPQEFVDGVLGEAEQGEFQGQMDSQQDDSGRGDSEEARKIRAKRPKMEPVSPAARAARKEIKDMPEVGYHADKSRERRAQAVSKKRILKKRPTGRGESLPEPSDKDKFTNPFINP